MREDNKLVSKALYRSGAYVFANGPAAGQVPESTMVSRREAREYSITHTPEEPFEEKPRGKILLQGSLYSSEPAPAFPQEFAIRREVSDWYSEQEAENETHLYTRDETTVHNRPPHHLKRQLQVYHISHVTSPTQFYMVEIDSTEKNFKQQRKLPGWWYDMQNFYGAAGAQDQLRFEGTPGIARVYVMWNYELDCWERGRVLKVDEEEQKCGVFFLDLGIFENIRWNEIKELVPDWSVQSPLALTGKLQHVYPRNLKDGKLFNSNTAEMVGKQSKFWSDAAVKFMKTYAEGKYFYGINVDDSPVYAITKDYTKREIVPKHKKFGMVFLDLSLLAPNTLNAELCLNGHGICIGMGASTPLDFSLCPDNIETLQDMQDELQEVFDLSDDIKDSFLALTIGIDQKPAPHHKELEDMSDFFSWRAYGHLNEEVEKYTSRIPKIIRQSLNLCDLTTVVSPSCFYVLPASRISLLKELACFLSLEMDRPGEDSRPLPLSFCYISIGVPIVVRKTFGPNPYFGVEPTWYRAVISQIFWHAEPSARARAILVDFGMEIWVDVKEVYDMPKVVRRIPAFCFRAHLNTPNHTPAPYNYWSPEAVERFASLLPEWLGTENADPPYYVWESYPKNVVELDVFDQNLDHVPNAHVWKSVPAKLETGRSNVLEEFVPIPIQERLQMEAIEKHDLTIVKRLNAEEDEEEIIVESEYTRLAPGCQIIPHNQPAIMGWDDDDDAEENLDPLKYLPPFKKINTPEFETLCGPLFNSIGVDFSYEIGPEENEDPETYELAKASDIFLKSLQIKRQHIFDRMKWATEKGDPIRVLRETEKLPVIYKFVPNYDIPKY